MPGVPGCDEESLVTLVMEEVEVLVAARGSLKRVRSRLDQRVVSVALYKLEICGDLADDGSNRRYLQIIDSLSFGPKNLHLVYKNGQDPRYL